MGYDGKNRKDLTDLQKKLRSTDGAAQIGTSTGDTVEEALGKRIPLFVQDVAPNQTGKYVWFDTSGGDLTLWIEDGS